MERPLKDVRPLGPFAQSEEFTDRMLSKSSDERIVEGANYMAISTSVDIEGVDAFEDAVFQAVEEIGEFVQFEIIGDVDGIIETTTGDQTVTGIFVVADIVDDPEVTEGQVQDFIEQEMKMSRGESSQVTGLEFTRVDI